MHARLFSTEVQCVVVAHTFSYVSVKVTLHARLFSVLTEVSIVTDTHEAPTQNNPESPPIQARYQNSKILVIFGSLAFNSAIFCFECRFWAPLLNLCFIFSSEKISANVSYLFAAAAPVCDLLTYVVMKTKHNYKESTIKYMFLYFYINSGNTDKTIRPQCASHVIQCLPPLRG